MAQWLRLRAPNAGGPGSIPGQGTRSRMPQLKKDPACGKEDPGPGAAKFKQQQLKVL